MITLHERQLAMLVLHFCLRYTIQCITSVQQGPQSSILFRMGPHQIVPSQALLSQSDTELKTIQDYSHIETREGLFDSKELPTYIPLKLTHYYRSNSLRANPDKTQVTAFHLRDREAKRSLKYHGMEWTWRTLIPQST